ncbi:hypothetical protein ACIBKY_46260 [Nonomuraea sp. NPDC050394]|uniref:hypothetical protein n=1 Tax=Nonomuraea sp. NPDC050394 TaxID=3364363 RepID=UPI0037B8D445
MAVVLMGTRRPGKPMLAYALATVMDAPAVSHDQHQRTTPETTCLGDRASALQGSRGFCPAGLTRVG